LKLVKSAELFAKKKHKGQFRKRCPNVKKVEYAQHLKDVVCELKCMGIVDEDILCTGWLHDTIEDTDIDYDDIHEKFNKKIADYVASVTKDTRLVKSKQEKSYISQLKKSPWQAKIVKLGDIIANFIDLEKSCYDFTTQKSKVKKKIPYILAIRSGIRSNKNKIPNFERGQNDLDELLKKYGQKAISF
jgi:(p)ppGpp synthase/HD superfamily hydrolase